MLKHVNIKTLDNIFIFDMFIIIFIGSVGIFGSFAIPFNLCLTTLFLGTKLIHKSHLKIPKYFLTYSIFLSTLLIHTLIFNGKIIYFWMFLSGGLTYLSFYNLEINVKETFFNFLIIFAFLISALFLIANFYGLKFLSPDNLFLPLTSSVKHNHLGDLWALIIVLLLSAPIFKNKILNYIILLVGLAFLVSSHSRSAILSLIVGLVWVLKNKVKDAPNLKKTYLIIFASFIIFIIFGIQKSTFLARPYYLEAINSIIKSPWGIGMGNFSKVSTETNNVHNIILEVATGMGVFSLVFLYWLYKILKDVFERKNINIEYSAIFLALFTNFLFDSTYVIMGMLWIWFIFLDLI